MGKDQRVKASAIKQMERTNREGKFKQITKQLDQFTALSVDASLCTIYAITELMT